MTDEQLRTAKEITLAIFQAMKVKKDPDVPPSSRTPERCSDHNEFVTDEVLKVFEKVCAAVRKESDVESKVAAFER